MGESHAMAHRQVHFNSPMNPLRLELEVYHQIKDVIGVNPTFYEYLFMIDADTTVDPLSLDRFISACVTSYLLHSDHCSFTLVVFCSMVHDRKVLGVW